MCITNSSTMLCGISIDTYLHADQPPVKVIFYRKTKGRILQTLTETDMATVVVSNRPSSLPKDSSAQLFATLLRLWRACPAEACDVSSLPGFRWSSNWRLKARIRGERNQKQSSSAAAVLGGMKADAKGKGKQKEDKEEDSIKEDY